MITVGCDPELMIVDKTGQLVSAIPLFEGTKHEPTKIKKGMVQHDNVNVEFGIDAARTEKMWVGNIRTVLVQIIGMLPKDHRLLVRASDEFPESQLNCEEAVTFGCDPDFDAYEVAPNVVPPDAKNGRLRSCGGHIHVGHKSLVDNFDAQLSMTKAMDVMLGVPSILIDKDPTSARRRNLYGKAGAHRLKPYGIEYRSLSNFWVSTEEHATLAYRLTKVALDSMLAGHFAGINEEKIRATINNADVKTAREIVDGIVKELAGKALYAQIVRLSEANHIDDVRVGWDI